MKELKLLLPYLKRYRLKLAFGFVFVTLSNICSTIVPRVVGVTIDTLQSRNFEMSFIFRQIALVLGLTALSGFLMYLTRQTIIVASRLIEYDLRGDFLLVIESQPMEFFHKTPTGELMSNATNDIGAAREFLGPALMYGANTITTFVFALYFMLSINVEITLLALIPLPILAVGTYILGKKIHFAFKNVQQQFSELSTQAQETFSGIRVVKSYGAESRENELFSSLSKNYLKRNMHLAKIYAFMMPTFLVMVGLTQLTVLGYGGYMVINGKSTLGELTQYFIYLNLLIWPVAAIGWVTNIIQRASASAGRLAKIFNLAKIEPLEIPKNDNVSIDSIEFRNVSFAYNGSNATVISNLNLILKKGKSLGIVGEIGSGKSTLISLLMRFYDCTSGDILINGRNILTYSQSALRSMISIVPQDIFLFSDSILENIRFSMPSATTDDIKEAARKAHLDSEIEQFPNKYDTVLGERGISLSGGQKQRLALARALLSDRSVLILDDALSSIDADTEEKILDSIYTIQKDKISIIISHRISSVINCDNIIYLSNGNIIESGSHTELMTKNGRYAELYYLQKLEKEIETS